MIRAITALLLTLGVIHAQEITTYGPWQGYWTKARLSAYSPHDRIDAVYRATKGDRWRWITADGRTDVRTTPYGIAAPSGISFGTRIFVPGGHGYLDASRAGAYERCFTVDDRGSAIERGHRAEGVLWLDLRFRTEYSALAFGIKEAWVFVITGDK